MSNSGTIGARSVGMACLLAVLATVSAGAGGPAPGIQWVPSYAGALEQAARDGKPVLIDFTADWCVWCKRMDDEVYRDAAVANALKGYVCVKVDVGDERSVALAYNVQEMPRTIVLNIHGEMVGDVTGYMPLGVFLEFLTGVKADLTRKTGGMMRPTVQRRTQAVSSPKPVIDATTPANEIVVLLGDRDPAVRDEAVRAIGERPEKLHILVTALSNELLGVRITALGALRKAGVADLAFDPWAAKAERESDVTKWKAWLAQTGPEQPAATP